jgi:hypothetical protein
MKAVINGLIFLFLSGCVTSNRMMAVKDKNLIDIKQEDGEEYELLVLDPGFETWFLTTWSPAKDRSLSYYKMWNQRYVNAWNYKATRPNRSRLFENMIQYEAMVDYGMDVERKLYYYFRWVDTQLKIPILDTPPPGGIL